ncbi:DUF4406 domain-containing protein [Burkholderia anthina]|uniref:DUF4406 domain-containing protein n=1 Tax=Burkholderia anthina TaxID=179879 RepID=UPI00292EB11E|nr:DUF4406 domain-containing protein [Burkholderia anthina]WJN74383.1 hypothetical protein OH687_29155 [Burkholderia anthina]
MKIYIAGPMTGHPNLNFPTFHAEAARLRALGYEVINPAELNAGPVADWLQCMRVDIKHLVDCDAIAMLEGWQTSRGASLEYTIAMTLGHAVFRAAEIVDGVAA